MGEVSIFSGTTLSTYCFHSQLNICQSSDEENDDVKKDKPRPRVHSSTARKQLNIQEAGKEEGIENKNMERERKVSECTSGNESDFPKGNYRKVTRLSSEQIVSNACCS